MIRLDKNSTNVCCHWITWKCKAILHWVHNFFQFSLHNRTKCDFNASLDLFNTLKIGNSWLYIVCALLIYISDKILLLLFDCPAAFVFVSCLNGNVLRITHLFIVSWYQVCLYLCWVFVVVRVRLHNLKHVLVGWAWLNVYSTYVTYMNNINEAWCDAVNLQSTSSALRHNQ